jgi:hypothetical protein
MSLLGCSRIPDESAGEALAKETRTEGFAAAYAWACGSRRRRLRRAGGEALAKETRAEGFAAAEAWACGWGGAGEGDEGRGIRGGGGAGVREGFAAVEARAGGLPGGGSLHCPLNC